MRCHPKHCAFVVAAALAVVATTSSASGALLVNPCGDAAWTFGLAGDDLHALRVKLDAFEDAAPASSSGSEGENLVPALRSGIVPGDMSSPPTSRTQTSDGTANLLSAGKLPEPQMSFALRDRSLKIKPKLRADEMMDPPK